MIATCVPWGIDTSCCNEWEAFDPALVERAEELAWNTLRTLTAGRVGACPVTLRPCLQEPCGNCAQSWSATPPVSGQWVVAYLCNGIWTNCACGTACSCELLCEIVLPGPVAAVIAVDVGGVELEAGAVRIDNGNRLLRADGECWPSCQYMDRAPGAPGTLTIYYIPGVVPGSDGLWAAGVLACEFAKACSGGKCRLPSTVTSVVREGVTLNLAGGGVFNVKPQMWPGGMTGIREVDAYITSINPNALRTPPMVWSPDAPWTKHRFATTTAEVIP